MGFNTYRTMWIFVLFDLPTTTKKELKAYNRFRKMLLKDGFEMFQFSTYIRVCPSKENKTVHVRRVKAALPDNGKVGILTITDKQFGLMEIFEDCKKTDERQVTTEQLNLF